MKQIVIGVSIIENFFPSVRKMLPSIFELGQHFTNFGSEIFNDDLDASHYLYNVKVFCITPSEAARMRKSLIAKNY